MSKGRLSKIEKFYIIENQDKLSIEELMEDLGRSAATIAKVIKEHKESTPDTGHVHNPQKDQSQYDRIMDQGRFSRHGRDAQGKPKGKVEAVVMVPAASELSDDLRSQGQFKKQGKKDGIHKPKG